MAFANQVAMGIQSTPVCQTTRDAAGLESARCEAATRDLLEVLYGITAGCRQPPIGHQLLRRFHVIMTAEDDTGCGGRGPICDNQQRRLRLGAHLENGNPALGKLLTGLDAHSTVLHQSLRRARSIWVDPPCRPAGATRTCYSS